MSAELPKVTKEARILSGSQFQKKFLQLFNALYPERYHLVPSTQDYETFDYYLFKEGEKEPFLIELKTRPNKFSYTFNETLVDYLKIIKLRQLSKRSYVIICFEDKSVIIDVTQDPSAIILGQYDNMEKPVALYEIEGLKTLAISLEDLRAIV